MKCLLFAALCPRHFPSVHAINVWIIHEMRLDNFLFLFNAEIAGEESSWMQNVDIMLLCTVDPKGGAEIPRLLRSL